VYGRTGVQDDIMGKHFKAQLNPSQEFVATRLQGVVSL